jgi:hypothetical protein
MYRPIDPIGLNIPPAGLMALRRLRRRSRSRQPISPEDNHFHAFTKWPRQGKAIEHAH